MPLDSTGLNPSWVQTTPGTSSARSTANQGKNLLEKVNWDQVASQNSSGPNILSQLLQESYLQALENYQQRSKLYVPPSKMTQDVIAALSDHSVKNKSTIISRICDGDKRPVT